VCKDWNKTVQSEGTRKGKAWRGKTLVRLRNKQRGRRAACVWGGGQGLGSVWTMLGRPEVTQELKQRVT
jgi:hypothetical protein